ncbi:MAG: hypothetical protein GX339_09685 [Tissierellia bacterium]|nr:hypothetical protein [Tissierellia bacterium]
MLINPILRKSLLSSVASVGVVYTIVDSLIVKESTAENSIVMKSLPLQQRNIVIGFYMFSAAIIITTALAVSIFPAVKSVLDGNIIFFRSTFIINIVFCIFIFSIAFPFIYKFGYSKTKPIITIVVYGILPLAIIFYYIHALYTRVFLTTEAEFIVNIITNNFTATAIACLLLYLISMSISIKAYS